jgi:hypothetical protein
VATSVAYGALMLLGTLPGAVVLAWRMRRPAGSTAVSTAVSTVGGNGGIRG